MNMNETTIEVPREMFLKIFQFAFWCFNEHRENSGDLDGFSIQEKLIELKLLEPITVDKFCGENCRCAEYYNHEDLPIECLIAHSDMKLQEWMLGFTNDSIKF